MRSNEGPGLLASALERGRLPRCTPALPRGGAGRRGRPSWWWLMGGPQAGLTGPASTPFLLDELAPFCAPGWSAGGRPLGICLGSQLPGGRGRGRACTPGANGVGAGVASRSPARRKRPGTRSSPPLPRDFRALQLARGHVSTCRPARRWLASHGALTRTRRSGWGSPTACSFQPRAHRPGVSWSGADAGPRRGPGPCGGWRWSARSRRENQPPPTLLEGLARLLSFARATIE